MNIDEPNIEWYLAESRKFGLTPRCPFATVEQCPRYFHSLAMLEKAGFTSISPEEDKRLEEFWSGSDLLPRTSEFETEVISSNSHPYLYSNFCPEISYSGFGLFASMMARFADEIDQDSRHRKLRSEAIPTSS